jgi:hypothetical protein
MWHVHSLTPGQRYYYVYGGYYGWSAEKSFKAAPSSKGEITTNVIAFGGPTSIIIIVV